MCVWRVYAPPPPEVTPNPSPRYARPLALTLPARTRRAVLVTSERADFTARSGPDAFAEPMGRDP